ncbi:hypothetical protein Pth03_24040 [Planotetraspora thailandica]|uniref:Uncharacterized protein n=1 Tax=Planotetraspora thailandica TaxID=487172 RepID=A0A8J3VBM6_9ACTN|nr:hypothetical protein Pth03_24040 [Planotetraspora thailandica]
MVEVAQRRERLGDDVVAPAAGDVGHHGDAAGVVLVRGVIKALGLRKASGRAKAGSRHLVTPVVIICSKQRDDVGPAAIMVRRDYRTLPE